MDGATIAPESAGTPRSVDPGRHSFSAKAEGQLNESTVDLAEGEKRPVRLLFDAPPEASGTVAEVLDVLGLGSLAVEQAAPAELAEKARQRDEARAARDFARADALRDEIVAAGWEVRDTPDGAVLYRQ